MAMHRSYPRVLLADPDPETRFIVGHVLKKHKLQTREAPNGREALSQLLHEPFDLAVLDLLMPFYDGFTILKQIRESSGPNRDTPIVVLTSLSQSHHIERALRLGANDFVVKPFAPEQLYDRVSHLILASTPPHRNR